MIDVFVPYNQLIVLKEKAKKIVYIYTIDLEAAIGFVSKESSFYKKHIS